MLKSRKNLTRFTYESADFEGWRLIMIKKGSKFARYFSDRTFGGPDQSLAAAEQTLEALKAMLDGAKLTDGKFTATTLKKAETILRMTVEDPKLQSRNQPTGVHSRGRPIVKRRSADTRF